MIAREHEIVEDLTAVTGAPGGLFPQPAYFH